MLISPHFYPAVGGVETHLNDLCKYLSFKKHTVYVRTYRALTSYEKGPIHEESEYLKIHRLPWPDFNLYFKLEKFPLLKFLYIFLGLFIDSFVFLLINHKNIDVIQTHGIIVSLAGVILGKIFSKRVVITTHVSINLKKDLMGKIIKWTFLNSDKILVLTDGIKKSLVNNGIAEERVIVYHYWVDKKIFYKRKDAKKMLRWDKKFVVLFVGRLIEVKGVRVIFDLAKRQKNITFVIIGSGPLSNELSSEAKNLSNILFLGKLDNMDLPLYYSSADLLLIPSKIIKQEYEEGIPRVMIEALSCSLPVVSTKSGGIPDVFSNKIGILVDDNVTSMENALSKLYRNKTGLKSLAQNCRSFAFKFFGISNAQIIEKSLVEFHL